MSVLETNVDDMDPRLWPTVLASLLDAGAADAWLVPIVMKKGRPAHTLAVLTSVGNRDVLTGLIFELTSTIGVREVAVSRVALGRTWVPVLVAGDRVRIKVAHRGGQVVHATPEFDDAAEIAAARSVPVRRVLEEAIAAAQTRGPRPGQPSPWDVARPAPRSRRPGAGDGGRPSAVSAGVPRPGGSGAYASGRSGLIRRNAAERWDQRVVQPVERRPQVGVGLLGRLVGDQRLLDPDEVGRMIDSYEPERVHAE